MSDATNFVTKKGVIQTQRVGIAMQHHLFSFLATRWIYFSCKTGLGSTLFSVPKMSFFHFRPALEPEILSIQVRAGRQFLSRCSRRSSGFRSVLWAEYDVSGIKAFVYEYNVSY